LDLTCGGRWLWELIRSNARGWAREFAEEAYGVRGHDLSPLAPALAAMTSFSCPLPGRDASKVVFPNLAPASSVVAAYPLGLCPATAASPDLSYSGPYGHLLPHSYTGPATSGDSYLPCQQPMAPSQPFRGPAEHSQEAEAGKSCPGGSSHLWSPAPVHP
jgi:hypothetical protein